MRKFIFILIAALLLAGLGIYVALGGFTKPVIATVPVSGYIMAGVAFKGSASNEDLLQLFEQTRELHQENKLLGTLAALYYDIPQSDKGQVDAFIGVIVEDSTAKLPSAYSYRSVAAKQAIQANITIHYLVAPSPEKIRTTLLDYAREKGLPLQNFVIEQYLNNNHIIIEIPVSAK
jgi:hypothetical protein